MTSMHNPDQSLWRLVASHEMHVRLRSKLFWISTAAMSVLIAAGVLALHVFLTRTTTYHVAVTTPTATDVVNAAAPQGSPEITAVRYPDRDAADAALAAGHVDAVLLPPGTESAAWTLETKSSPNETLQEYLARAVEAHAINRNAQALHLPTGAILNGAQLRGVGLAPAATDHSFQYGVTFAFGLLFFMSCQLFGATTANSVVEEKESRVVEVILAAIPVRALLLGKIVGNALLGVIQMALFAVVALSASALVGTVPHLTAIARSSGWFLLYYLVGFGTVCCLFAGLGALASRTQDVQSATAPVQLIITATYMCSVLGKGAVLTVASFIPITSTVTMPARIFGGTVPWWQITVSFVAALAFAVLAVRVATRAYQNSVLHTGARLSLRRSLRGDRQLAYPAAATTA